MAGNTEPLDYGTSGASIYAIIRSRSTGQWWNGTAMEAYTAANYANYDVAMPELGTSSIYLFTTPATLPSDDYDIFCRLRAGGTPAETDDPAGDPVARTWDGTTLSPIGGGGGAVAVSRYARYPTAADLTGFLADANLTVPSEQLDIAVQAGIEDLENACSRHFLAGFTRDNQPQAPYTRSYDPPGQWAEGAWATMLDLGDEGDLARLDSVIFQPSSSGPVTYNDGEHYRVGPHNAIARGKAVNWLEFARFYWSPTLRSSWGAIKVTGLWGYGLLIPPDVWVAFLANAALALFSRQFRGAGVPLGLKSWKGPEGISKEYDASMLTARIKEWGDLVGATRLQNARLSFG